MNSSPVRLNFEIIFTVTQALVADSFQFNGPKSLRCAVYDEHERVRVRVLTRQYIDR